MEKSVKKTFLLVDDDNCVLSALNRMFRSYNIECIATSSPVYALELLTKNKIHLIMSELVNESVTLDVEIIKNIQHIYDLMNLNSYVNIYANNKRNILGEIQ